METAIRAARATSLGTREAGYSAVRDCLRRQAAARPRGRVAIFLGLSPLHPDARPAYDDAVGKLSAATQLAGLSDDWTVVHAVPLGSDDGELDHVVIGPGGIFVISTRNWRGRKIRAGGNVLTIDGHKTDEIRSLRYAERRASDLLRQALGAPVAVSPVIVVADSASLALDAKSPTLPVLTLDRIPRWFTTRQPVLSETAVARISAVAVDESTWCATGGPMSDGVRYAQRFDRLRREVDAAGVRAHRLTLASMGATAIAIGSLLAVMLPGFIGAVTAAVP